MITNFESITEELTESELAIVDSLTKVIKDYGVDNPIKAPELVKLVPGITSEVRLRKLTNFIRTRAILPLIATSKGYYVSYDKKEIEKQIFSLKERANSMLDCTLGLSNFLPKQTI